jgi:hypothetical protein
MANNYERYHFSSQQRGHDLFNAKNTYTYKAYQFLVKREDDKTLGRGRGLVTVNIFCAKSYTFYLGMGSAN